MPCSREDAQPRDFSCAYHKLIYFEEVDKGGQIAAWEQPEVFAAEVASSVQIAREFSA